MIDEKKNKELEDLFRNKLEESEVEPGGDLTGHFMRRLGRKEFMRFNARRINIFYAGAVFAVAATVSGMLLVSPEHKKSNKDILNEQVPKVELTKPEESVQDVIYNKDQNKHESVILPDNDTKNVRPSHVEPEGTLRTKEEISPVKTDARSVRIVKEDHTNNVSLSNTETLKAAFEASVTSGCVPLNVTFRNLSSGAEKSEWSFGDGGNSSENEVNYIYDLPGTYEVILTITSESGRQAVVTTMVEAWPRPKASFEIPETDLSLSDEDIMFNNLSTDASKYIWYFGDGFSSEDFEPTHKYEKYGKYDVVLVAISENGCTDSVSIVDAFTDSGLYLRFPNAFTPDANGPSGGYYSQKSDLNNQVFHPVSSGVVNYDLKIYSKQGLMVFETDDLLEGWDGYYKGRLCSPGVYIWKVRATYRNGAQIVMSGDVTLLNY